MSELQMTTGRVTLSTRVLVPAVQRIGDRDIEMTFLGNNSSGNPAWMLWNAEEPYLIGVLCQVGEGFTLEQRTDQGVLLHENLTFRKLQVAIGGRPLPPAVTATR